jgi:hypothetical protein
MDTGHSLGVVTVLRETDRAILVEGKDLDEETWIPKSMVHEDSEVWKDGQEAGELVVKTWFARERGWE